MARTRSRSTYSGAGASPHSNSDVGESCVASSTIAPSSARYSACGDTSLDEGKRARIEEKNSGQNAGQADHARLPKTQRQAPQHVAGERQQTELSQQQRLDDRRHLQVAAQPLADVAGLHQGSQQSEAIHPEQHAQHDPEIAPVGQGVRGRKVPYTCHLCAGFFEIRRRSAPF